MINNYALFNHHEENDTLLILFSDKKITQTKNSKEVEVLYSGNELVGYKIPDFIRYAKIKYSGIVFYPNRLLIDVINSVLSNSDLETLTYKTESGYLIKRNGNTLGVFAKEGTFLRDETISQGRYCSYYDLYIENENDSALIEINDENLENKDFFGNKEF